jgi:hypothetical protein
MTKEESMSRNINLAFDFVDYLVKNPSEAEKIPDGSTIRFVDSAQEKNDENTVGKENIVHVRKVYEFA